MRKAFLPCVGLYACLLAGLGAMPALAQPAPQDSAGDGADQVVGLFGATCLRFPGDVAGMRGFLKEQKAPEMPEAARDAFLAGRPGDVFDVSYKTTKLALISMNDGGCEAVAETADPQQVVKILTDSARENGVTLTALGAQASPKGRPGVVQTGYGVTLNGQAMHILVSTAPAAPQAVLTLVPK
jgi:hypothetical protein